MPVSNQHYKCIKTGKRYKTHGLFDTDCSVLLGFGWIISTQYKANDLDDKSRFEKINN